MAITSLPTPPSRSDPENFPERADAFMAALPNFVTEANALGAQLSANVAAVSAQAFGVNQSWQDVANSRAASVTYTNSTGRPVLLALWVQAMGDSSYVRLNVNGSLDIFSPPPNDIGAISLNAVVPSGSTYMVELVSCGLVSWWEYR